MAETLDCFDTNTVGFLSNEEVQNLRRLLFQFDPPSTVGTSNLVQSGITCLSNFNSCPWIIDSGANRHMTGSSKIFLTYSPEKNGDADGSFM